MTRYLITLSNAFGELDRRETDAFENCRDMAAELIAGVDLYPGDVIRIIDREEEDVPTYFVNEDAA